MACLGVHFALFQADSNKLLSITDAENAIEFIKEDIENRYFESHPNYLLESGKVWDLLHDVFCQSLESDADALLSQVILDGDPVIKTDDYIISFKSIESVQMIANRLATINDDSFMARYDQLGNDEYDDDVDDALDVFNALKDFFMFAAEQRLAVVFTVDQ